MQGKTSLAKYPEQGAGWPAKQLALCILCLVIASSEQFSRRSWKASITFWL
jgi:hypothetical protein